MSHNRTLRGSVAFAAMFASTAAHADLTADAVWQAWQDNVTNSGHSISAGSELRDGNTLKITNVAVSGEVDFLTIQSTLGEIILVEQGDGTVAITMSESYTGSMIDEDGSGVVLSFDNPGLRLVAAATDTGISYELNAPEMTVSVAEVLGEDAPDELVVSITALGVSGSYELPTDPNGPMSADAASAAINAVFRVKDEFTDLDSSFSVSRGAMNFVGTGLELMEDGDPAAALRGGFAFDLGMSYDTVRFAFEMEEWGEQTAFSGGASDGASRYVMNSEEIAISSSSRNGEMTMSGSEIPFPVLTLKSSETSFGFRMPVSAAAEAQDFNLGTRLVEATVSDEVWGMVDPTGRIPRSPATLIFDLAGKVTLFGDLFAEETVMGVMMAGPFGAGELGELNLRELMVRLAGAELTGSGGFTFDSDDLETFEGLPRPTGVLEFALRGGNALLDTLVDMGIVPTEEAMGARMMLALFTRPGDGPDELLTTLEVREDGAVLANGQRIQ